MNAKSQLSSLIVDGVLDLSQSTATVIDASRLDMTRLLLPEGVTHVDVRYCRQLQQLTLPRSVREANVSGCCSLRSNIIMEGLPERLVLADPQDLYGWYQLDAP